MIDLPVLDAGQAQEEDPSGAPKQRFWRSPSQLKRASGYEKITQNEFMPGATETASGPSRRQFMQLMGASMAMLGLSACRRPVEKILPYTRKPEEVIPGIERYYATSMPFRGSVRGLLVESHEGRPTKAEGNPDHPVTQGTTSHFEQASVLSLYDPDRSDTVLRGGARSSWQEFADYVQDLAVRAPNLRLTVLAEKSSSPTTQMLRDQLRQQFPNLNWVTYSPTGEDPSEMGMQRAFGQALRPLYNFSEAQTIVSLDADFLGPADAAMVRNTKEFSASRRLGEQEGEREQMSRLYVVESQHSITGAQADHRLRMRSSDIPALAAALASELGAGSANDTGLAFTERQQEHIRAMAGDLREAGSQGVVVAGDTQPPEVHALAAAINSTLGAIGTTVELLDTQEDEDDLANEQRFVDVVDAMRGGQVDALLMVGVNPVYSAPERLGFREALRSVQETIHVGLYVDETAQAAGWHVPRAHYLEAWGDGRAYDGTLSVIQPLIAPLYDDAHSDVEVLNLFATGIDEAGYDVVRRAWRDRLGGEFEQSWRRLLHDGFVPDTGYASVQPSAGSVSVELPPAAAADDLEVVFRLDPTILDGSFGNNAWCQELPDPTTKITWDNVATMSPATADLLGLEAEYDGGQYYVSRINLNVGDATVDIPVWVAPGHADGSITVTLGYGRSLHSERPHHEDGIFSKYDEIDPYGRGPLANRVGVNVASLKPTLSTAVAVGADVQPTGETYMIATTQDHGALDIEARPLYRMGTLEEFEANPNFPKAMDAPIPGDEYDEWDEYPPLWVEDHPSDEPAYKDNLYYDKQWGMTIDLQTCTGCNSCVIACQSENNIQVVGKDEVARGREMHWLRIDRYYVTDEEMDLEKGEYGEPQMVMQPVPCMHCENAPCESVCPVAATVHSPDGTNQMIYNRCIGTRYCSNNCPYKVRRYNWFNWSTMLPNEVQMAMNPNVTMRFRGVMEKCSYCIQRIRAADRRSTVEERRIEDGEVLTACQQACPADAITFGDIVDPNTAVSKRRESPRRYEMLAQLGVKPRTSFLARVRNLNPALVPETEEPVQQAAPAHEPAHG